MDKNDIELLFRFAKLVKSTTSDSIQNYKSNDKLLGYLVQHLTNGKITAIWFDAEKLTERDLKYFFKYHKESDKHFFINYLDGFYRIGFKTKKTAI